MKPPHGPAVDQIIAEEDLSVLSLADPARVLWHLDDQQRSTRDLVGSDGLAVTHYVYDSFGRVVSGDTTKTRYLYTNQEYDADALAYLYNARWYGPDIGRFWSEDPIGFAAGDTNLSRYVENGPTNATDPSGLRPISFKFDAFIPGRLGKWLPEPGGNAYDYFKSDEREAGQPGTSRLFSEGSIESTKIGTATADDVSVITDTGRSYRKTYKVTNDKWYYYDAKATPHGPDPIVESTNTPKCQTEVTIEAWANYPFLSWVAPSIYYKVTFTFFVVRKNTVAVVISATHSTFPDFEGEVDGQFPYVFQTTDSGPSYTNLWWNRTSMEVAVLVKAETDLCCPTGKSPSN